MAKRDPAKTARNRKIESLKQALRDLLPLVLQETGYRNEGSLNATIGSKHDEFIDLKHEVINSAEEFSALWLKGFKSRVAQLRYANALTELWDKLQASKAFQQYLMLYLERSYLKHYDELSKARPLTEKAEVWIGQNNADYGLLVTPRFRDDDWENDRSEIRHFKPRYWSVGHVLETGLVVPGKNRRQNFKDLEDYLCFFCDTLVRLNGSQYGNRIAERYSEHVLASPEPLDVLLLIPEIRYAGKQKKHKYRLDFCILDVDTGRNVGFELSPWSTHGQLSGKDKTLKQLNAEASENFQSEVNKYRSFFRRHDIAVNVYSDDRLSDVDDVFDEMAEYLTPRAAPRELALQIMREIFG